MATLQRTQPTASKATSGKRAAAPPAPRSEAPTPDQISARAYEIWQENGCPEGCEEEHWYQAERELRSRATK